MSHRPETALQIVAAQYLDYALPCGMPWTAVDPGDVKLTPAQASLRKRRGIRSGWPDLQMLWRGTFIGIELKAPKGRLRASQTEVGLAIVEQGGVWFSARSIADIEQGLRAIGVPLRATTGQSFAPRAPA